MKKKILKKKKIFFADVLLLLYYYKMSEFRVPEVLVVDKQRGAEEWNRWLEEYEIYECAKELDLKSEKVQIEIFLNIIGSEEVNIFKNFKEEEITIKIEGTDKKVSGKTRFKWIKDEFNSYFIPKRNVT